MDSGAHSIPFGLVAIKKTMARAANHKIGGRFFRSSDAYSESVLSLQETGLGTTASLSPRLWVSSFSAGHYLR